MAVWLPAQNQFYLPPTPVTRILSTDDFVRRTPLFYHGSSERLLTVGHPYFPLMDSNDNTKVLVPKVSSNQYRVFRCILPDPNKFAFGDPSIFNPDNERLVWACRGIEVTRGGPLGVAATGNPLMNKFGDVENPFTPFQDPAATGDKRFNVAFDPKQTQLLIVGCRPPLGEHWKKSKACSGSGTTGPEYCPPIEIETSVIQDGDMVDIGLGHMDFKALQVSKSESPLDISGTVCKYPDFIQMTEDVYGDHLFFYAKRESLYARHIFVRGGATGKEAVPGSKMMLQGSNKVSDAYFVTPSGSLVSSEAQMLNRPYWIQQSQGHNNGVCWHNDLFITVVDTTRATNFTITTAQTGATQSGSSYDQAKFYTFLRHAEEYQLSFVLQLCKVSLSPETMAYIHTMDPSIIDEWHLTVAQPTTGVHEKYRYISSIATKCPADVTPVAPPDPYKDFTFWTLDFTEKLTADLDQTPLGRKFLFQNGLASSTSAARVAGRRARTLASSSLPTQSSKRRRK